MDGATLQSKVWGGYAKAAKVIGLSFDLYRPVANSDVIVSQNKIATIKAQMTPNAVGPQFLKPSGYDGIFWQGLLDGSQVRIGDYLVNAQVGTWFIAEMAPLLPILCVSCNATATLMRPRANASDHVGSVAVGAQAYQGVEQSTVNNNPNAEDKISGVFPCAISARAMGKVKGLDITPSDSPGPTQWWIYPSPAVVPEGGARDRDVVIGGDGYRYQVASAFWTTDGYRLQCTRLEA